MPAQPAWFSFDLTKSSQTMQFHDIHSPRPCGGTGQRAVGPDPGGAEDLTDKLFEL